ncbi:MAG: hypothetical protein VXZ72_04270, partial [Chlamydiota bacterium]|nr:hypothetical protein [Chlamydiota bacterium]
LNSQISRVQRIEGEQEQLEGIIEKLKKRNIKKLQKQVEQQQKLKQEKEDLKKQFEQENELKQQQIGENQKLKQQIDEKEKQIQELQEQIKKLEEAQKKVEQMDQQLEQENTQQIKEMEKLAKVLIDLENKPIDTTSLDEIKTIIKNSEIMKKAWKEAGQSTSSLDSKINVFKYLIYKKLFLINAIEGDYSLGYDLSTGKERYLNTNLTLDDINLIVKNSKIIEEIKPIQEKMKKTIEENRIKNETKKIKKINL